MILSPDFVISLMIRDLSAALRVGDEINCASLAFPSRVCLRALRDLSVDSRAESFTAAMYWGWRELAELLLHEHREKSST